MDGLSFVQMILAKPMNLTTQELTALTINLTHVPFNSEVKSSLNHIHWRFYCWTFYFYYYGASKVLVFQRDQLRYVAIMWALTTPQTILTVESNWGSSQVGSNCKPWKLSFEFSELELSCRSQRRSKWRYSSSWSDRIGLPICVNNQM